MKAQSTVLCATGVKEGGVRRILVFDHGFGPRKLFG